LLINATFKYFNHNNIIIVIIMKSIFERELAGELISTDDPEYQQILDIITETMNTCRELNSGVHTSEENLEYLSRIIGKEVDESVFFYASVLC